MVKNVYYYIFGCLFIFFKMFSGKTDYQSLMVGQFEDYPDEVNVYYDLTADEVGQTPTSFDYVRIMLFIIIRVN